MNETTIHKSKTEWSLQQSLWLLCGISVHHCRYACCVIKSNISSWDGDIWVDVDYVTDVVRWCLGCFSFKFWMMMDCVGIWGCIVLIHALATIQGEETLWEGRFSVCAICLSFFFLPVLPIVLTLPIRFAAFPTIASVLGVHPDRL